MELNFFTEKYLERISAFATEDEVLVDIAKTQSDVLEKMKQKGATLNNYNSETITLYNFYEDLDFIKSGINGSWKDNLTNDYKQKYFLSLELKVKQIIKKKF